MKPARVAAATGITILGAALATAVVLSQKSGSSRPILSHGQEITSMRTVLVASGGPAEISSPGAPLRTILASGAMPPAASIATVVSDENCAPDAAGVSHCTNRLRMADGTELVVVHPHRMSEVPCLAPGESVHVRAV